MMIIVLIFGMIIIFFSLMVNEEEDVLNWILDDTDVLSQKVAKVFYSAPTKTLVI